MSKRRVSSARPVRPPLSMPRSLPKAQTCNQSTSEITLLQGILRRKQIGEREITQDTMAFVIKRIVKSVYEDGNAAANSKIKNSKWSLSNELNKKLNRMKKQVKQIANTHRETRNDLEGHKEELSLYRDKLSNAMSFQGLSSVKDSSCSVEEEYRLDYEREKENHIEISSLMTAEKTENEHLRLKTIQQRHKYSLLKLKNGIMGECLRRLYTTNQVLHSSTLLEATHSLFVVSHDNTGSLHNLENRLISSTIDNSGAMSSLIAQDTQKISEKCFFISEIKTQKSSLRKITENLKREISLLKNQNSVLCTQSTALEKKHTNLTLQYEKLSEHYKCTASSTYENICKCCKTIYNEDSNYQWSCRRHLSPWTKIYFCCGSRTENSRGCVVSRHLAQEDGPKKRALPPLCSSCNCSGHSHKYCPNDPNPNSHHAFPLHYKRRKYTFCASFLSEKQSGTQISTGPPSRSQSNRGSASLTQVTSESPSEFLERR